VSSRSARWGSRIGSDIKFLRICGVVLPFWTGGIFPGWGVCLSRFWIRCLSCFVLFACHALMNDVLRFVGQCLGLHDL